MADALDAVSGDVAARTKALLSAVATGGTAGLKAYEQSIASTGQAKTDAVTRAQQRAGLIGGPEAQGFEGQASSAYDRGLSNLGNARGSFEANMAHLGSAHKNYLDQVGAAVPLVRADTQKQLALKQQAIDAALAKDAADAEKAAEKEAKANKPKLADILNLSQNLSGLYAGGPNDTPIKGTVGPNGRTQEGSATIHPDRNWVTDDLMMTAADNAAFNGTTTEFELAKIVAEVSGLDAAETAKLVTPSNVATATTKADKALAPVATPDEKWLVSNVRGMDSTKAKQALSSPEFLEAGKQSTDYFAAVELDDKGNINDGSDYDGLSPYEAFRQYVYSLAGNRSMKDAAFEYYGSNLPK
jgi:hypothetical protein